VPGRAYDGVAVQPLVVAALVALVLLSAPPAVLAATVVCDLRGARRPLPAGPRLARLALALNLERAATPAQWRVARLRLSLFESCRAAHAVVAAGDDAHAGWLLGDAVRLARRLDDDLRALWPLADAAPALLEHGAVRVEAVRGALARLGDAVSVRAGHLGDERVTELVDRVEGEHVARLRAGLLLHRGGGLSLPSRDTREWPASDCGHKVGPGASAP
jgi:hypothetical protein